jgi:HAE1 family hydrophobic/amphiphilic exporter-1
MLLGLVVKNSILLVDFTNRLRRAGLDKHAALDLAGAIRLRPILTFVYHRSEPLAR